MAASAHNNNALASAQANAGARLEYLLDASYAKIEELRLLLVRESNLQMKNCLPEMDPVVARQLALHDTVMKSMNDQSAGPSTSAGKYPTKVSYLQPKNVKSHSSLSQLQQPHLPHSHSFPSVAHSSLGYREMPKFDTIRESGTGREKMLRKLSDNRSSNDGFGSMPIILQEKHWYGSLDRNVVKKKKRGPIDKTRRHTKIVGSMATLEQTDELQPDEQYKIGLPAFTQFDGSTSRYNSLFQVKPRTSRISSSQSIPYEIVSSPPPPPPPPKTNSTVPRYSNTVPPTPFYALESPVMGVRLPSVLESYDSGKQDLRNVFRGQLEDVEVVAPRPWFETNLDELVLPPYYSGETSAQTDMASGFNNGTLDVTDSLQRYHIASPATDISEKSSKSSESSEARAFVNETIKPFEMTDYYKYSTKFRKTQNSNQTGDVPIAELVNGKAQSVSTGVSDNDDQTLHLSVPKLPPRDTTTKPKSKAVPLICGSRIQDDETDSLNDTAVGWMMDTPTFV